jgi:hypothetical protein
MRPLITLFLKCLGVHVGLIYAHIIAANLSSAPNNVCFLVTAPCIKVISVSIYPLIEFIFLVMLSLMNTCFLLHFLHQSYTPHLCRLTLSCLLNLRILHTRLFCCLTMVQVSDEVLALSCWTLRKFQLLRRPLPVIPLIIAWTMQCIPRLLRHPARPRLDWPHPRLDWSCPHLGMWPRPRPGHWPR